MNQGQFATQITDTWELLKLFDLDYYRNYSPRYPDHPKAYFKSLPYIEIYKVSLAEGYYHLQLKDRSLVQFRVESYNPLRASYAFYECPFTTLSREEFIDMAFGQLSQADVEYIFQNPGDIDRYYEEYLETITDREQKKLVTPIRYDYSREEYEPGKHPISHFHIGHNTEIRIGVKKIITPIAFMLFIIRQSYPKIWRKFHSFNDVGKWEQYIRESLSDVEEVYWNRPFDDRELILA